eukprot:TRINITY_DN6058_c0_g1_i1.p1 TRINITY_DN6058_c0_g1~~TRINITY_DN6058_c0_g1_i1.p1  ORF type:complete len:274 (-),score=49.99 TRINITY_DN6058_c0_g1_i1:267-1067(-)
MQGDSHSGLPPCSASFDAFLAGLDQPLPFPVDDSPFAVIQESSLFNVSNQHLPLSTPHTFNDAAPFADIYPFLSMIKKEEPVDQLYNLPPLPHLNVPLAPFALPIPCGDISNSNISRLKRKNSFLDPPCTNDFADAKPKSVPAKKSPSHSSSSKKKAKKLKPYIATNLAVAKMRLHELGWTHEQIGCLDAWVMGTPEIFYSRSWRHKVLQFMARHPQRLFSNHIRWTSDYQLFVADNFKQMLEALFSVCLLSCLRSFPLILIIILD